MAAITPDSVRRENVGSASKVRADFISQVVNDGDTWASGMTGIKSWVFKQTDNPTTQASAGISVAESSGTFTFYPGENGATGYFEVEFAG